MGPPVTTSLMSPPRRRSTKSSGAAAIAAAYLSDEGPPLYSNSRPLNNCDSSFDVNSSNNNHSSGGGGAGSGNSSSQGNALGGQDFRGDAFGTSLTLAPAVQPQQKQSQYVGTSGSVIPVEPSNRRFKVAAVGRGPSHSPQRLLGPGVSGSKKSNTADMVCASGPATSTAIKKVNATACLTHSGFKAFNNLTEGTSSSAASPSWAPGVTSLEPTPATTGGVVKGSGAYRQASFKTHIFPLLVGLRVTFSDWDSHLSSGLWHTERVLASRSDEPSELLINYSAVLSVLPAPFRQSKVGPLSQQDQQVAVCALQGLDTIRQSLDPEFKPLPAIRIATISSIMPAETPASLFGENNKVGDRETVRSRSCLPSVEFKHTEPDTSVSVVSAIGTRRRRGSESRDARETASTSAFPAGTVLKDNCVKSAGGPSVETAGRDSTQQKRSDTSHRAQSLAINPDDSAAGAHDSNNKQEGMQYSKDSAEGTKFNRLQSTELPVDKHFPNADKYHVYREGAKIYSAYLRKESVSGSSMSENQQKQEQQPFFLIQVLESNNKERDYFVYMRSGADESDIGIVEQGHKMNCASAACRLFNETVKDRSGNVWEGSALSTMPNFVPVKGKYSIIDDVPAASVSLTLPLRGVLDTFSKSQRRS